MPTSSQKVTRRSASIAGAVSIPIIVLSTRGVLQDSAAPSGPKNLPPLTPPPDVAARASIAPPLSPPPALPWSQAGGFINDASYLDRTPIYGIVAVQSEDDISHALAFAREHGLKVSLAGVRHSMGGQAFFKNAVVLDMTGFNQMALDEPSKVLTVQSGATWHTIQNYLHPKYAVKAMQSTDIFTIGGSISVNAHGMDHHAGSIAKTIRSLRLMLPDGSIRTLSRTENPELFNLVIGGYGLFGVILDAQLEVTDNVIYESGRQILDYQEFPARFANQLATNPNLGLMYAHLSTAPNSLLREMLLYTYIEQDGANVDVPPLTEVATTKARRFVLNFSKRGALPMRLKWLSEKYVEPRLELCAVTRSQAMRDGEACLVSRNQPMHDSVKYLQNDLPGETDILHEYFIPRDQFVAFVDGLRQLVSDHEVKLLNASVRVVHQEDIFLNYAPSDMFSVVLYINQRAGDDGNEKMRQVTSDLIDLSTRLNGRFFLPYQLHYTADQLRQAYPEITAFFAAKQQYDPGELLTNTFYEKYAPSFLANAHQ